MDEFSRPRLASPYDENGDIQRRQFLVCTEEEINLLEAASLGATEKVKEILRHKQPQLNVNCKDILGRTPLTLAVENETFDEELIGLLIEYGANGQSALIYAVTHENIKALKRLLEIFEKQKEKADVKNKQANIKNPCTPLLLACKTGNFEIVKLLVSHGESVTEHSVDCECDVCSLAESNYSRAHIRLESYRVLSNPLYIAAQYMLSVEATSDPVVQAFELSEKLKKLASVDYEFKDEYSALNENLEPFPVDLLDECLGMKETRILLRSASPEELRRHHHFEEANHFHLLEFAIRKDNEKFVSHPYSQLLLNEQIFNKYPKLRNVSWKVKYFLLPLLVLLLLPVMVLNYVFCLNSHINNIMKTPLTKHVLFVCSYLLFLVALILSAFQPIRQFLMFAPVDWIVCIYVIGFCFDIVSEIYNSGCKKYFWNWYNYVLVAMVACFILYYAVWTTGRTILIRKYRNWETARRNIDVVAETVVFKAILISYGFYCAGTLLAFLYLLSIVHLHPTLGPLLMALKRMLKDLANFLLFFITLFVAFVVCLKKLYLLYNQSYEKFFLLGTNQTTWQRQTLDRASTSFGVAFWALFGLIELSEFEMDAKYTIVKNIALVLFGVFNVLAVLVTLNMLIAILNESFSQQAASPDIKWKLSRTKVLLSMMYRTNVLPPPFNVLTIAHAVVRICLRIKKTCCGQEKCCRATFCGAERNQKTCFFYKKRQEVMKSLVLRYLCTAKKGKSSHPEAKELNQARQGLTRLLAPSEKQDHYQLHDTDMMSMRRCNTSRYLESTTESIL